MYKETRIRTGVVMVTYNRLSLLKEAIDCVCKQTIPFEKIIIVNNCSTDGTTEYLSEFSLNQCFLIVNMPENVGGAGGFAKGIEIAQQQMLDWVLIIDDDAMIARDYMEKIIEFAEQHKNVNACSGIVKTNGSITTIHRRRLTNKLLFLESDVPIEEYNSEFFNCDLATFCGLVIKGEVIRKIGIPTKEYFIWYDDTEYCLRLKEYGGIYNVNAAILEHKTNEVKEQANYFLRTNWKYYYGQRNRLDTARKHCGTLTTCMVYLEMIAFILFGYIMRVNRKYKQKSCYNVRMLKQAFKDAQKHKLGKNVEYIP